MSEHGGICSWIGSPLQPARRTRAKRAVFMGGSCQMGMSGEGVKAPVLSKQPYTIVPVKLAPLDVFRSNTKTPFGVTIVRAPPATVYWADTLDGVGHVAFSAAM